MATIRVTCEKCGSKMDCPEADAGSKVLCKLCFHNNLVPAAHPEWDNLELDGGETSSRSTRNDDVLTAAARERHRTIPDRMTPVDGVKTLLSPSEDTPPAPPTQPKDPDKALTGVAIGIFRMKNWPCQEEPGYKAFRAKVRFQSKQLGVTSVDDYRVSASHGLLILETPVVELPPMTNVPILEMINEINQRSISSVFYLNDLGVMMRHTLIPHTREENFLTAAMILQTLRQINHDRRHALSLLREAVENKKLDPMAIARAFSTPAAACAVKSYSLDQTADLAEFSGLHANRMKDQLTLSRSLQPADKCAVHMAALPGFLRGWVTLNEMTAITAVMNMLPSAFRELLKNTRARPYEILEQVNRMNEEAKLVRFTYTKRQVVASATLFPTDAPASVEQFRTFAEALLHFAPSEQKAPPLAKAG